jgi:hypothetical protein
MRISCDYGKRNERPKSRDNTNSARNIQKSIFAILAAAAAIPPNPKNAAMIAIMSNTILDLNIKFPFPNEYSLINYNHNDNGEEKLLENYIINFSLLVNRENPIDFVIPIAWCAPSVTIAGCEIYAAIRAYSYIAHTSDVVDDLFCLRNT